MNFDKNILEMVEYPAEGILSKEIFKDDKLDLGLFCMAKGKQIGEHTSTKSGYVQVLEGKGVFNLEGEDIEMKPGVFIYLDANAKHSLKAEEETAFLLALVV